MGTARLGSVVSADANLNPFELVLAGAERARQLMRGSRPMVETEASHPTAIVLEEFAAGMLKAESPDKKTSAHPPRTESGSDTE